MITLNFKISELIYSETSIKYGIDNMPNASQLDNLLRLIVFCLQPLRDKLNKPMIITSGFRNPQVNRLVGGVSNSGHLNGTCADFIVYDMTTKQVYEFIKKSGIKYTQLIDEHSGRASWVHIQYDKNNLKCENLLYNNGKYCKD